MLSECSAKRASRTPRRSPRLRTEGFHSPTSSVVLEEEQLSSYELKNKQHDMLSLMMIGSKRHDRKCKPFTASRDKRPFR